MVFGKQYYVYIMASKRNGTIYIGVSGDIIQRVQFHKNKEVEGFTKRHNVTQLVYYEIFYSPNDAIAREKSLKRWDRSWKLRLIESKNPEWNDLFEEVCVHCC